MKKNYSLLKQYLLALTLLISTTIIVYSCKKDRKSSPLELRKELISEAKTYFEEEVLSSNLKLHNDPNFRHSIMKRADWEKAITKKISAGDAVVVPIHFDGNIFSGPANSNQKSYLNKNSYLMIYKDHGGKMHAEWVTLLPNNLRDNRNGKFSGVVVVESWNGRFNRAFAFNDAGKHIPIYISEAVTFDQSSYKRNVTCFEVEYWGSISWADGPPRPRYLGSETFCSDDGSGNANEGQGPRNNPVTEEEAAPDDYITYYIDCNEDLDGAASIDPNCGCIGGNTGIQSCADITDKIKNKCLDSVWTKVSGNLDNKITNILNNTFNTSDKINFKIVDGNIDGGYARTQVVTDKLFNGVHIFDVKVTLNKNTLPYTSNEFIATTIVHEIMHAYFDSNKVHYTQQLQQHKDMAEGYIEDLKNAVQSIYPAISDKNGYALVLNGFGDIFENYLPYWNTLLTKYDLDNQQITTIRDSYKNHVLGTETACSK